MTHEKLSEKTIKQLPVPTTDNHIFYFAGATIQGAKAPRGFGVRVTAAGARAFILNYRLRGREHRLTIGAWPDWSVLKAVREARNLRQRVDRGENPLEDRAQPSAIRAVSTVLDEFMARYVRNKEKPLRSADAIESALNRLVKPRIGKVGVYELRRSHIAEMMDWIEDKAGPVMADKCRAYIRKALSWYVATEPFGAGADQCLLFPASNQIADKSRMTKRARKRLMHCNKVVAVLSYWVRLAAHRARSWPLSDRACRSPL
jgi:hypothetical protein